MFKVLGCDVVLMGKQFSVFQRTVMPSSVGSSSPRRYVSEDEGTIIS
jgi:hypothetical protein